MTKPGPYSPGDTPLASEINTLIDQAWSPFGPYIRVRRTTDQTGVTNNTNILVNWSDAPVSDRITWSSGTPSVVTIQQADLYFIGLHLIFTANTTGHRWGFVTKNSTDPNTGSILYASGSGVGGGIAKGFTAERLAVNDVLRVYGHQDSGSSLSYSSAYGGSHLTVAKWAD